MTRGIRAAISVAVALAAVVALTASPAAAGTGIDVRGTATPATVTQGSATGIQLSLTSPTRRTVRVLMVMRDADGDEVARRSWGQATIVPGATKILQRTWTTTSVTPGRYSVNVAVTTTGGTPIVGFPRVTSVTVVAPGTNAAVTADILALVNARRAEHGCGAVTQDARLGAAAQGHAEDMRARNYFSHTSWDGREFTDRILATGYDYRTAGENIARGQRSAGEVMTDWMNSPGHRANILNCGFRHLGVGYATGSGGPWWVQDFGSL